MTIKIRADQTVSDLIADLKRDIAEKSNFLAVMEKYVEVGETQQMIAAAINGHETPVRVLRDTNTPTIAERIFAVLNEAQEPLSQVEIRDWMRRSGVEGTHATSFLSKIYTAMSRKPHIFARRDDQKWSLVEWDSILTS